MQAIGSIVDFRIEVKPEAQACSIADMERSLSVEAAAQSSTMKPVNEPRWLSEDEQAVWMALGSVVFRLPGVLDSQLQRDAGIGHFEYVVMSVLSESPERTLRMSELAVMAEAMLPRLSQVVARLEKRGWLRRAPDPADGRYTLATLTDSGWDKVVATAPGHVEAVRSAVFDPLTKAQLKQLREISRRIMGAIDPEDRCLR